MSNTLPISACILVKNEEDFIGNCIRSLKKVVEEINVIDTGSDDQTVKIAEYEKVNIYDYKWDDNFSNARNYAISISTKPYILMIDADEVLGHGSIDALRSYIQLNTKIPATVQIRSIVDDDRSVISFITRLFPNIPGYRYEGVIHEQLSYNNEPLDYVETTKVVINHHGYKKTEIQKKNKINRNLVLLKKQLESDSNSLYLRYQLGQTYYVSGNYTEAIKYFDDALNDISKLDYSPNYLPTVLLSCGYCFLNTARFGDLDNLINIAIELYPDFTDLYFLYGVSLIERKDISKFKMIKEIFEFCLQLGEVENRNYETVEGVGSYRALYNLGVYHEVTNNIEEAITYYKKSAEYNFYQPAIEKIKRISQQLE